MSFTVILALLRATRRGGVFVRTPKYQIVERGQEGRDQAYVRVGDPRALGEALLGAGAIIVFPICYGLIGFVGTLIVAALYNVLANMVGGIEMDVE